MKLFTTSKKRIIVALITFVILLFFSMLVLKSFTSHDFIISSFLFLISAALICVKVSKEKLWLYNSIMIGLALVYLFFVPLRMYLRTEVLINDMLTLFEGTTSLNVVIILLLISVLLFVSQSTSIAFGVTGIICLIFSIINFYVYQFRGSPLSLSDLFAARTAVTVMNTYNYSVSTELWKSFAYYFAFISLGFNIRISLKGWKSHIFISLAAILLFCGSLFYYKAPSNWSTPGLNGDGTLWCGEAPFGEYLYFIRSFEATSMKKEADYSDAKLTEIKNNISSNENNVSVKPNIIMIMNEAWSDLRVLGDIETTEPYMPFYYSLKESNDASTGYVYVNIQGGMTADTEFEALTGDSLAFLDVSAVPFQMQVNHNMSSLATVLSAQGYETVAMHPNSGASWSRDTAYPYLGFENTVFFDDYNTEKEYVGAYVSDRGNYREVIYQYENRDKNRPWFMFNVTIQNHSAYWSQTDILLEATKVGNTVLPSSKDSDEYRDLNVYLNLMKISDDAIKELTDYFANVSEPTIICMFGDHQPLLYDQFYSAIFDVSDLSADEQKALQFITPYFIWANYDAELSDYGDLSASYLGAVICDAAKVQTPVYYDYLLKLRKDLPFFNRYSLENYDEALLKDYRILMYNHLMEKEYRKDIFEINK